MPSIYEVRKKHGSTYVTIFQEDDLIIPWKPLSLSDYFRHTEDMQRGIIPIPQLEDEVFRKCVVDQSILKQYKFLKAGIVSTVVHCIWQASAPTTPDGFNEDMNLVRSLVLSPNRQIYNQLIFIIISAFPSYNPDELLAKTYEELLHLGVLAEERLLTLGVLQERFSAQDNAQKQRKKTIPKIDHKAAWDQAHPTDHGIDFDAEASVQDVAALDNHDRLDWELTRERLKQEKEKMADQAALIYGDLTAELDSKE